jgi:hypothetical protein
MRNRDLLEGMRRDLDVWIKFPERPPGIILLHLN